MPRPHAPGEPLVVSPALLAAAWSWQHLNSLRHPALLPDGRVRVEGLRQYIWIGADLACLCQAPPATSGAVADHAPDDDPCVHQLLAALRRGWPCAPQPGVAGADLHDLARALTGVESTINTTRFSDLATLALGTASRRALALTEPGLDDDALLDRLREHDGATAVPALAAGRRQGPVRDWGWTALLDLARHSPTLAARPLALLLRTAPRAGDLDRLLRPLSPAAAPLLVPALAADPALTTRVVARLTAPALAALLAAAPTRALREQVARHLPRR